MPYPFDHDDLWWMRNATLSLLILLYQQSDRRCAESRKIAV